MPTGATATDDLAVAYQQYAEILRKHCCYRRMKPEDAEEIVQDAFMQTFEYLEQGKEVENMKVFLYKVANNLIVDQVRREKSNKEVSLDELREKGFDLGEDSVSRVNRRMEARSIIAAAKELESKDYELFSMRFLKGLMPVEIARKTGSSANSVSVRLHRLLRQVTSAMSVQRSGVRMRI